MNPHAAHSVTPAAMLHSFWINRYLLYQLTKRDVASRYKGSLLGLTWTFVTPLIMLITYTFIFSVVFKVRWGTELESSKVEFALILFIGLLIYTLFSEVLNSAASNITLNINYVKKIVFPLEILMLTKLGSATFHLVISFFVLLIALTLQSGLPNVTVLYAPLTIAPILPLLLGLSWFLTSLGVYFRDIGLIISVITSAMLFLSPVLYPVESLPPSYKILIYLNPITLPIEETRAVVIFGLAPNWEALILYTAFSITICWAGFWSFQKTRKGFHDYL